MLFARAKREKVFNFFLLVIYHELQYAVILVMEKKNDFISVMACENFKHAVTRSHIFDIYTTVVRHTAFIFVLNTSSTIITITIAILRPWMSRTIEFPMSMY